MGNSSKKSWIEKKLEIKFKPLHEWKQQNKITASVLASLCVFLLSQLPKIYNDLAYSTCDDWEIHKKIRKNELRDKTFHFVDATNGGFLIQFFGNKTYVQSKDYYTIPYFVDGNTSMTSEAELHYSSHDQRMYLMFKKLPKGLLFKAVNQPFYAYKKTCVKRFILSMSEDPSDIENDKIFNQLH